MVDADSAERFNNMFHENLMLHREQQTVDGMTAKNIVLLA